LPLKFLRQHLSRQIVAVLIEGVWESGRKRISPAREARERALTSSWSLGRHTFTVGAMRLHRLESLFAEAFTDASEK